jgi:hypothetical protein
MTATPPRRRFDWSRLSRIDWVAVLTASPTWLAVSRAGPGPCTLDSDVVADFLETASDVTLAASGGTP